MKHNQTFPKDRYGSKCESILFSILYFCQDHYIRSLSTTIIKPDVVNDQNQSNTCYVVNMLLNNI